MSGNLSKLNLTGNLSKLDLTGNGNTAILNKINKIDSLLMRSGLSHNKKYVRTIGNIPSVIGPYDLVFFEKCCSEEQLDLWIKELESTFSPVKALAGLGDAGLTQCKPTLVGDVLVYGFQQYLLFNSSNKFVWSDLYCGDNPRICSEFDFDNIEDALPDNATRNFAFTLSALIVAFREFNRTKALLDSDEGIQAFNLFLRESAKKCITEIKYISVRNILKCVNKTFLHSLDLPDTCGENEMWFGLSPSFYSDECNVCGILKVSPSEVQIITGETSGYCVTSFKVPTFDASQFQSTNDYNRYIDFLYTSIIEFICDYVGIWVQSTYIEQRRKMKELQNFLPGFVYEYDTFSDLYDDLTGFFDNLYLRDY